MARFRSDAPVTGDLNRPVAGTVALQLMERKARQLHVRWCGGYAEADQDAVDFPGEMWRYSSSVSVLVEAL